MDRHAGPAGPAVIMEESESPMRPRSPHSVAPDEMPREVPRPARASSSRAPPPRPERPDRPERPERPERSDRPDRPARPESIVWPMPGDPSVGSAAPIGTAMPMGTAITSSDADVLASGSSTGEKQYNPGTWRPNSIFGNDSTNEQQSQTGSSGTRFDTQRFFHSRRVKPGEIEKPWLEKRDPKEKWVTILPLMGISLGLILSGFLVWDGLKSVVHHKYCPVIDDDFTLASSLDDTVWTKEVELGGFGFGQFQQTTASDNNVYFANGALVIKAEPQQAKLMETNNVINLLKDGTCTSTKFSNCVAATNVTNGNSSVVPPATSGRLNTKKGAKIKYGRVEVTAKLPQGDWLWPAIMMWPADDAYGAWPRSGSMDIAQSRGNNHSYAQGGNNIVNSAIHWGPNVANDAWWRTNNKRQALHTTYAKGFNTFGLEWSQKYIFTYVNSYLLQVTYTNFNKNLWKRGGFPDMEANGTKLDNPWTVSGDKNAPYDRAFYLVLSLAVGSTNGWFQDAASGKPWADNSPTARRDFWSARDAWEPTWTEPTLEVTRVKILQQCDGNEEL